MFCTIVCVPSCVQVFHNIEGDDNWAECFNAPNIDLPTGYYFGFSAATGDLAGLLVRVILVEDNVILTLRQP